MSITSTFNGVKAGLEELLKRQGKQLPSHELGSDHLSDAQSAPYIVWEPIGAQAIEPDSGQRSPTAVRLKLQPPLGTGEALSRKRVSDPGQIFSRQEVIQIHVGAKTFVACEELLNDLVGAMRLVLTGHSFVPKATDWTVGQASRTKGVTVCLFTCMIKVPITEPQLPVAEYPLSLAVEGDIVTLEEIAS